jgi:transposase
MNPLIAEAVIPPSRARRKESREKESKEYDMELYKQRNLIEGTLNKLKNFSRVAARYR